MHSLDILLAFLAGGLLIMFFWVFDWQAFFERPRDNLFELLLVIVIVAVGVYMYVAHERPRIMAEKQQLMNMNLIEYYQSQMYPPEVGVAIAAADVELRGGPGHSFPLIKMVSAGARVFIFATGGDDPDDVQGDWVRVSVDGDGGWMDGKKLHPGGADELGKIPASGLMEGLTLAFPESTWYGKILGVLGGVVIALIVRFVFEGNEFIEQIQLLFPLTYYMFKTLFILRRLTVWQIIFAAAIYGCISLLIDALLDKVMGWND